ncbi:MAG: hypothetical protein E6G26_00095 [Actinobacteria bacterium]|nr:MAG: hypothetical protein E6G26_00095 [Actinomycetota bacterium]
METGRTLRESSLRVTGWRAWVVTDTAEGPRLGSVLHDLLWQPGGPVVAECRRDDDPFATPIGPHPVPAAECNCGFHAVRDPVDALSYARGRDEPGTVCRILGEVVVWGHVLETEAGWRASHAYPARLYVPDAEIAAALATYSVPVCGSPSSQTCTATPSPSELRSRIWRIAAPS